jgi:hypothetical protein
VKNVFALAADSSLPRRMLSLSLFLASKRERERADIEDKQHAASLGAADTSALIFPELRPSPPPPVEKLF